jgi:HK97 family phage major capsid protein
MKMLIRTIHPAVRVLDEKEGLVEYVASDETLDSYKEVIKADGWRFDEFRKNAPFVDSHNYSSLENQVGRVVDFKVQGKQLIERVKWAIDVPSNKLAQLGFDMTKGGYLCAVSVGFVPVRMTSPYRDPDEHKEACEAVKVDPTQCQAVYLEQQQKELSACIIGANPNALAKAHRAGVICNSDIEFLHSRAGDKDSFMSRFEEAFKTVGRSGGRVFAGWSKDDTERQNNMKSGTNFLAEFGRLTGETKGSFDDLEKARRGGSESEIERAVRLAFVAMEREKRMANGDPVAKYLGANPEHYEYLDVVFRWIGGVNVEAARMKPFIEKGWLSERMREKAFLPSDAMAPFPQPVSENVLNLTLYFGVFRDFFVPMPTQKTRFAKLTGVPNAYWINSTVTTLGNRQITADTALAGANIDETANTVATIIEASREVLADGKLVIMPTLLLAITQGLGKAIDYVCMQGNGVDDQTNGLITGMFVDNAIPATGAGVGEVNVKSLTRASFCNAVGAIAPGALQRPENCRWWISPSFIGALLQLKDGPSGQYLLQSPSQTKSGEFEMVGFPVSLTAQAPSIDGANKKIAAFGNRGAYLAAIREDVEVMSGDGQKFNQNINQIRGLMRGFCQTRDAASLTVLSTAAA